MQEQHKYVVKPINDVFKSVILAISIATIIFSFLSVQTSARADQTGINFSRYTNSWYNYVPSVMMGSDGIQKFWWCSGPQDIIMYMAIDVVHQTYITNPVKVLEKGPPGSWDAHFTCDPSVVRGVWNNPLGNGVNYGYAMYYTGTDDGDGNHNGVGVAFSNDGIYWDKFPYPIFRNAYTGFYGVGEQTVIRVGNNNSDILMFVVVKDDSSKDRVEVYSSNDGLYLSRMGQVSNSGLIQNNGEFVFSEPAFAYDWRANEYYVTTNRTNSGSAILDVYKISAPQLLTGTWQFIKSIGIGETGQGYNGDGGFLTNEFGHLTPFLPTVQVELGSGSDGVPPHPTDLRWYQFQAP